MLWRHVSREEKIGKEEEERKRGREEERKRGRKEDRKRGEKCFGGRLVGRKKEGKRRKRGREVKNGLEARYSSGQEKKMRNRLEAR